MLTHACGKMSGYFADVTGITAPTCKLINHTPGIGSFTPNNLPILKEEKTSLISKSLQWRLITSVWGNAPAENFDGVPLGWGQLSVGVPNIIFFFLSLL